jgi:predicted metal-dependent hydrolase
MPHWAPVDDAIAFVQARETWIRTHVQNFSHQYIARIGVSIPIFGRLHKIVAGGKGPALHDGKITLPPGPYQGRRLKAFLTYIARDHLVQAATGHAATLGRVPNKITLRDTQSRWGSCSSAGNLMFSWRLIMAPPGVLDYVAAHEAAHLVEMNHSARFWAVCADLCPSYQTHRTWLKNHGGDIMALRFDDPLDDGPKD